MAVYTCIRQVSEYLEGLGFDFETKDYRYFYYTDSEELQDAIAEIPNWGKIWYSPPWA